ncbi:MAG: hypothetical protein NPIRA01_07750 [Nitrospirales bacterium]|nr:MAG: hypothetical protein NPIRA01_07750 [Nitrospirales bacterium]
MPAVTNTRRAILSGGIDFDSAVEAWLVARPEASECFRLLVLAMEVRIGK